MFRLTLGLAQCEECQQRRGANPRAARALRALCAEMSTCWLRAIIRLTHDGLTYFSEELFRLIDATSVRYLHETLVAAQYFDT